MTDNQTPNEHDGKETEEVRCRECQRELRMGENSMRVEWGVMGPRGFVPLGDPRFFCDYDCARSYFCDEPVEQRPRRVP